MTGFNSKRSAAQDKMTDLRQAAQMALEALEELNGLDTETECVTIDVGDVIATLKVALEQQAEPPEWPLVKNILAVSGLDAISFVAKWQAAQQQADPVAWRYALDASVEGPRWIYIDKDPHQWLKEPSMVCAVIEPLYTTPPQRQWVGLEIEEVQDSYNSDYQAQTRAVEAKLKERNG